jgi:hypothetical protein
LHYTYYKEAFKIGPKDEGKTIALWLCFIRYYFLSQRGNNPEFQTKLLKHSEPHRWWHGKWPQTTGEEE